MSIIISTSSWTDKQTQKNHVYISQLIFYDDDDKDHEDHHSHIAEGCDDADK